MVPQISDIQFLPTKPRNGLIGFASFVVGQDFAVNGVAIHTRPNGDVRLVYPDKLLPNGLTVSLFHPIRREIGEFFTQEVSKKISEII